jgi:DNA replication protein DnaC
VLELPPLPPAVHTLSNEDSDRLKREFGEALAVSPEDCRTCYGSGTFRWYARASVEWNAELDDPSLTMEFKCPCDDQWILNRFLLNCGIKNKYQRFDWHDLDAPILPPEIRDYLSNAKQIIDAGLGLVLYGSEGTGKTLLAVLLLKILIARGHHGYFTTYSDMIQRFHEGRYDREEREWFLRRVTHASVLVIDDIGREQVRRTLERSAGGTVDTLNSTAEFLFEDVIRHRVAMASPTFITSNLALGDLATKYGSNVMSLLEEQALPVELTGRDWRNSSRDRANDEVRQGLRRPVVL